MPPHCREQGVRALPLDDRGERLDGQRLNVGPMGQLRIGHDRRRIGVDEDDRVSLLLECLARLGAGIVELTGLSDDDRS